MLRKGVAGEGWILRSHGSVGATRAQASMCNCDAVLLDYEMPFISGHKVASEIRLMRPNLVIIVLSGTEVPTQAPALVDAFVPKLESSRQLLPVLAELCR
jgi:CheY-like chemotaxis protein